MSKSRNKRESMHKNTSSKNLKREKEGQGKKERDWFYYDRGRRRRRIRRVRGRNFFRKKEKNMVAEDRNNGKGYFGIIIKNRCVEVREIFLVWGPREGFVSGPKNLFWLICPFAVLTADN